MPPARFLLWLSCFLRMCSVYCFETAMAHSDKGITMVMLYRHEDSTGRIGGHGGREFDYKWHGHGKPNFTIARIGVWRGEKCLYGIEVETSVGAFGRGEFETSTSHYGRKVGEYCEIRFNNEIITHLSLWGNGVGTRCGRIWLKTTTREFDASATHKSPSNEYKMDVGSGVMVGIYGRHGMDIDCLGFIFLKRCKERIMTDMVYSPLSSNLATIIPQIHSREYSNDTTNTEQKYRFHVEEKIKESQTWESTDTWEHSYDVSVKVSGKFPIGVGVEVEARGHWAWGSVKGEKHTKEKNTTVRDDREVRVPPGRKVMAAVVVTTAVVDVPYTARMKLILLDDTTFTYQIRGTFRSATISSQKHHVKETDITEAFPVF